MKTLDQITIMFHILFVQSFFQLFRLKLLFFFSSIFNFIFILKVIQKLNRFVLQPLCLLQ